jgi:hypothetical protein
MAESAGGSSNTHDACIQVMRIILPRRAAFWEILRYNHEQKKFPKKRISSLFI